MADKEQTRFSVDFKFASRCCHCGKPMEGISIDRYDREPGPLGAIVGRDVYVMWVNPAHDCTFLSIAEKAKEAA